MATNQNGQDKNPDHFNTLGNALTEYQSPQTSQPQQSEVKTMWLPDVARRICNGDYEHELLEQAREIIPKCGGIWQVVAVWLAYAAAANNDNNQAYPSFEKIAYRLGHDIDDGTVSLNVDVLLLCGGMKVVRPRGNGHIFEVSADLHPPDVSLLRADGRRVKKPGKKITKAAGLDVGAIVGKLAGLDVGAIVGDSPRKHQHQHSTPTPQMNGGDDDAAK